ncbi:hypothetical protein ACJX0J_007642, partial [Zea mays]
DGNKKFVIHLLLPKHVYSNMLQKKHMNDLFMLLDVLEIKTVTRDKKLKKQDTPTNVDGNKKFVIHLLLPKHVYSNIIYVICLQEKHMNDLFMLLDVLEIKTIKKTVTKYTSTLHEL